jgi:hypothetical protein
MRRAPDAETCSTGFSTRCAHWRPRAVAPHISTAASSRPRSTPGDFDACWESVGVVADRQDPELLDFSDKCVAQKARYGGELYPADWPANSEGISFLDLFQRDRITKQPKGIIAVDLRDIP